MKLCRGYSTFSESRVTDGKHAHMHAARSTTKSWCILEKFVSCETMMQMMPNCSSDEPEACFVGKNENTEEFLLLTPQGALKRRVLKRPQGSDSWGTELSSFKVGDPWNPNNTILGSAGEHFASAWFRDE